MGSTGVNRNNGRSFIEDYVGRPLSENEWSFVNSALNELNSMPDRVEENSRRTGVLDPSGNAYQGNIPNDPGFLPPEQFDIELARVRSLPGVDYTIESTQVRNMITRQNETWRKITYSYKNPQRDRQAFLDSIRTVIQRRRQR